MVLFEGNKNCLHFHSMYIIRCTSSCHNTHSVIFTKWLAMHEHAFTLEHTVLHQLFWSLNLKWKGYLYTCETLITTWYQRVSYVSKRDARSCYITLKSGGLALRTGEQTFGQRTVFDCFQPLLQTWTNYLLAEAFILVFISILLTCCPIPMVNVMVQRVRIFKDNFYKLKHRN